MNFLKRKKAKVKIDICIIQPYYETKGSKEMLGSEKEDYKKILSLHL